MLDIKENEPLARLTTLGVGGVAEFFLIVKNQEELRAAVKFAKDKKLSIKILGGGSNVLINDEGVRGLVIKNEISGIDYREEKGSVFVTAGSGVVWDQLVENTVAKGLWGLENLSAIPGSVGATPVQNVGAYGVEVADLISEVLVYDAEGDIFKILAKTDCQFGYRDSVFKSQKGRDLFIISVTYELSSIPKPRLQYKDLSVRFTDQDETPNLFAIREAVREIRANKFPDIKVIGTAGSFFKNPIITKEAVDELLAIYPELPTFATDRENEIKISLGFILDKICSLRGYRLGNVGLYEKQALVLVNYGNATANEITAFAEEVAKKVFEKTKIKINWEVNIF